MMENATKQNREKLDDAQQLRSLHIWSWYIKGAREILLRLREYRLTAEEHHASDGSKVRLTHEYLVHVKAILDLLLSSKENIDHFLSEEYDIRFTDHQYGKRGRFEKCRAYFAKKVVKHEEVR